LPEAGEFSSAFFAATIKHHMEALMLIAKLIAVCVLLCAVFPPLAHANDMLRAVEAGETDTVKALIAKGTPVDVPNVAGETPLLIAVQQNHLDIALALIEGGANINAQAQNMDTPWLLAGASGRTEMLRAMIPKGPDFTIRNRYGGNALIPACERAHVETIDCCSPPRSTSTTSTTSAGPACLKS
jgi:ankyrin repeat protein